MFKKRRLTILQKEARRGRGKIVPNYFVEYEHNGAGHRSTTFSQDGHSFSLQGSDGSELVTVRHTNARGEKYEFQATQKLAAYYIEKILEKG